MPDAGTRKVAGSRRWFIGAVAATAGSVAVHRAWPSSSGQSAEPIRFFDVVTDPEVVVSMTNGEEFSVSAKDRATGEVIEHHDGVTATTLLELQSDHFDVVERSAL
ncbi:MAG: hypothetical protein ACR2O6_11190 [Ilumatobacteraceae bacterium]